jgi:hypothetical protein
MEPRFLVTTTFEILSESRANTRKRSRSMRVKWAATAASMWAAWRRGWAGSLPRLGAARHRRAACDAPIKEAAKDRQEAAGERGKEGGRGKKKPSPDKNGKGLRGPTTSVVRAKAAGVLHFVTPSSLLPVTVFAA